jgi:hypothetical protein
MTRNPTTQPATTVQKNAPVRGTPPTPIVPPAPLPIDESELKPLASGAGASATATPAVRPAAGNPVQPAAVQPAKMPAQMPAPVSPSSPGRGSLSFDKLSRKYGSTDPLEIGRKALNTGAAAEAIFVLEALPDNGTDMKTKYLLLLEAYIESGRNKDALFIATSQTIQDAHFDILCGRLYQSLGKSQTALDCFENALTKRSTVRSHAEITNDAVYYSAVIRGDLFHKDPTADNREQALAGWNNVKKMYMNNQDHARFKQAEKELSSLK